MTTEKEWIESYQKLLAESLQFAPCQVGDLVECSGTKYKVSQVKFLYINKDSIRFEVNGRKIKKNGDLYEYPSEIHYYNWNPITVIEKAQ